MTFEKIDRKCREVFTLEGFNIIEHSTNYSTTLYIRHKISNIKYAKIACYDEQTYLYKNYGQDPIGSGKFCIVKGDLFLTDKIEDILFIIENHRHIKTLFLTHNTKHKLYHLRDKMYVRRKYRNKESDYVKEDTAAHQLLLDKYNFYSEKMNQKNNYLADCQFFSGKKSDYIISKRADKTLEQYLSTQPVAIKTKVLEKTLLRLLFALCMMQNTENDTKAIVHNDIKPDNILIYNHADKITIKLSDFGYCTESDGVLVALHDIKNFYSQLAPEYYYPSVQHKHRLSVQADMYSVAIAILKSIAAKDEWEIIKSQLKLGVNKYITNADKSCIEQHDLEMKLKIHTLLQQYDNLKHYSDIIAEMLKLDPTDRPNDIVQLCIDTHITYIKSEDNNNKIEEKINDFYIDIINIQSVCAGLSALMLEKLILACNNQGIDDKLIPIIYNKSLTQERTRYTLGIAILYIVIREYHPNKLDETLLCYLRNAYNNNILEKKLEHLNRLLQDPETNNIFWLDIAKSIKMGKILQVFNLDITNHALVSAVLTCSRKLTTNTAAVSMLEEMHSQREIVRHENNSMFKK